jgi:hypothetical protein
MKKIILSILTIAVILTVIFASCKKGQVNQEPQTINLSAKSESEKISIISNDNDWKLLAKKNLETINKLVTSNIDINKFDFSDEDAFLKILGKSKIEYLNDAKEVKSAASRLITKYYIAQRPTITECMSCKTSDDEVILKIKRTVTHFRENQQSFNNFEELLVTPSLVAPPDDGGGSACCPWRFYACITLCAATIEAFPAYLLCCGFCFDTYCCK